MADYRALERQITEAIGLNRRPVAVSFARNAPVGVRKFSGMEPAGCSFWRLADGGDVFYTSPAVITTARSDASPTASRCRRNALPNWTRRWPS